MQGQTPYPNGDAGEPIPDASAVGRDVPRIDGRAKVSGATRYAGDLLPPGALHAALVTSPHARAAVVRIDCAAARALPGVVAVLNAEELLAAFPHGQGAFLLAEGRVNYAGQPVTVVLAETPALATDGASAVVVDYAPAPAITDPLAAMVAGSPLVHAGSAPAQGRTDLSGNVCAVRQYTRGDVVAGLAAADHVIARTYRTARVHQGYLEPLATIALLAADGSLEVRTSTQALREVRANVAAALGRPEDAVRVVAPPVGGGFGAKYGCLEPLVAALALHIARPVALVLERGDDFRCTGPAPESIIALETGVAADGRITAIRARVVYDGGIAGGSPVEATCQTLGGYYRCENIAIEGYDVLTNKPAPGAYRGPGVPQGTFALESNVDEMARAIGMDPLAFRLANGVMAGDPRVDGTPWPTIGLRDCLALLQRHPAYTDPADPALGEGVGVAIGGLQTSTDQPAATCRLAEDGAIEVGVGLIDISGAHTALAQFAADAVGVPVEQVRVVLGSSDTAPYADATGGSKGVFTVGPAVTVAAALVRRQVLALAADVLEVAPDDLTLDGRGITVRGVPDHALTLATLARTIAAAPGRHEPIVADARPDALPQPAAFGAHLVRVRVDRETGAVCVLRYVAVQDVGRAINPVEVRGQIQGGVAQGFGWGLREDLRYDDDGQPVAASLLDYALPRAIDLPNIEVLLLETPDPHGPAGAKGVGEPPVVPGAAAFANAVRAATGARICTLPLTPASILGASAPPDHHARSGVRGSQLDRRG